MDKEVKKYTLEELKEKLTEKERIFCHEYIIDWNGGRSAKKAGYSEDSIYEIASQNLRKLHIQQYIDFIKNDIEKEAGISKLKIINELMKMSFSSMSNIFDGWLTRKEFDTIPQELKDCIESIETKILKKNISDNEIPEIVDVECVKIKFYSKIQAITELNKVMGYNAPVKTDNTNYDVVRILSVNPLSNGSDNSPE